MRPGAGARSVAALVAVAAAATWLPGCDGDSGSIGPEGPEGPAGPPGPATDPVPFRFFVIASTKASADVAVLFYTLGQLPEGTSYLPYDTRFVLPTMQELEGVDVVVAWENAFTTLPVGDRLADYVDAGGKVVLGQTRTTGGRIMTADYAPIPARDPTYISETYTFDLDSIDSPPHPVFQGVDLVSWTWRWREDLADPSLQGNPVLLASYTNGQPAVALNAAGNVLSINGFPSPNDEDSTRLFINGMLFLLGRL